jgi:hypothetical protein
MREKLTLSDVVVLWLVMLLSMALIIQTFGWF